MLRKFSIFHKQLFDLYFLVLKVIHSFVALLIFNYEYAYEKDPIGPMFFFIDTTSSSNGNAQKKSFCTTRNNEGSA